MKIYNTLTREKQEFIPQKPCQVRIYACGPTVYNRIHIGNARPLCVFDVLRRYLKWRGWTVTYVQNFTDIDDKLIRKAIEEGITVPEVAQRYIEEFWTDAGGLNILKADMHPKATENIDEILALIGALVEKGYAYESDGDVYFRARKFQEYGKLSRQPLEDLVSGARVGVSEQKEDPLDFALWKAAKPGEPFWDSPFGKGRPGWHIECSAMAQRYLGETIDIHCGGQDLIFPHHENEIAQSECATGKPFARYWMHNGYINVDNKKMSKSLGNFFTVRDVAEQYGYEPIRFMMISAHYRSPINYSVDLIEQSRSALERLYNCRSSLDFALKQKPLSGQVSDEVAARMEQLCNAFVDAMDDDLNTADALGVVFELVREINTMLADPAASGDALKAADDLFREFCDVLGLLPEKEDAGLDEEIEELIRQRTAAREKKDYATADAIRGRLKEMGVVLEDTPGGVKWKREK